VHISSVGSVGKQCKFYHKECGFLCACVCASALVFFSDILYNAFSNNIVCLKYSSYVGEVNNSMGSLKVLNTDQL
jgi:hypothetical protein